VAKVPKNTVFKAQRRSDVLERETAREKKEEKRKFCEGVKEV
jgi:hypothetical protein